TQIVPNLLEQDRYHRPVENKNIQHYRSRYDYIVQKFLQPWASENDLIFDDRALSNLDSVLCPLIQNSKECGTLRSQVQVLQQELLKRDEKTIAIPDEQFAQEFRNLTGLIKTVSLLMRPFEAMNIVRILGPCILTNGMAPLHHDDRVGKKLYIESCIWSTLIQMVFRTPFAVFGLEGNTVSNLWFNMYNVQHHHGWPHPSLPCETWRRTTMEQFMTMVNMAIVAQGERRTHHSYLEQCVVQAHANVVSSMSAHLSLIAPKVASSHLCRIVSEAFNLAVRMSLQRSRLQITFPKIGDNFSSSEMRNLSTSADEGGENGIVTLVVNPGLTKWGDAQGKNFEHRYNVVPALVQL
ncbi:hypothetical protein C7974DRAFT_286365, partial [Boeremia exigua]|uniref:uncharacterized protein n=1 Tax=Boeremia exigua TaxID=749465 RepID=UPI001E8D354C